ncbi:MAG: SGNH/GDSL hydrolase family protein [Phycisphaerae bacterium]|nr:SGNH/GDSL hydrolase family protein [Phycisphaerae bacterium]
MTGYSSTLTWAPALLVCAWPACASDFAIRDGDTVAFLGDSITAEGTYGRIIETYTLLRYPQRKVRFINAGWGGDTAAGGLKRLERDVLDAGATLVTVAYGINDIGWGGRADGEHKQQYLNGVKGIVERCKERGVRVFICSAAVTGENPDTSENGFLQEMCDEGMELSRSLGGGAIDVQRTMRECQRRMLAANAKVTDDRKKSSMHADDGIHLNELGQLAMAYAILKGLGAPADVSSATIDAAALRVTDAAGCTITDLERAGGTISFVRTDEGLPLNLGLFACLHFRFVPIPDGLNRYMLTVKNLDAGEYDVGVNDRPLGTFSHDRLAGGINIASATADPWVPGGPWDAQAWFLKMPTDARGELVHARKLAGDYLKTNPDHAAVLEQMQEIDRRLVDLQRLVARPHPYRFVIRPATKAERK